MSDRPDDPYGTHGPHGPHGPRGMDGPATARFGAGGADGVGGAEDPWAKAAAENFPVTLRVVPVRIRQDLEAVYRYARHVEEIGNTEDTGNTGSTENTGSTGDGAPADRSAVLDRLAGIDADIRALYHGDPVNDPVVADLASLVARQRVPADPLLRLVEANRRDQRVRRYDTFADLLDHCHYSADPVGELVLLVFGRATAERVRRSNQICTALQLLAHWQDVGEDYRRDRIYLPQEDLRAFSVGEEDLGRPRASEALRALIAFETARAQNLLEAGAQVLGTLSGWARVSVAGSVAGGRATCSALRRAGYDPLRRVPRPTSPVIAGAWLRSMLGSRRTPAGGRG